MVDPVTFKVFTDNTHIVAIRHGTEANVFAWETVERLNIKAKMWLDLVDDREFGRSDIITLQDPQNVESRDLSKFKFLKEGESVLSKVSDLGHETVKLWVQHKTSAKDHGCHTEVVYLLPRLLGCE